MFGTSALPARSALTTPGYAAACPSAGIEIIPVLPPQHLVRSLPVGLPRDHWRFAGERRATTPPAFVAIIPGGRVTGHYGAVVTPDNSLLFDLSPYFAVEAPRQHPVFLRPCLPPRREVPGTVAVLTTRGSDNYCHFVVDVLPRIHLLEQAGVEVDSYIVNRSLPFQQQLLDRFGIPAERVIESRAQRHVRADRLVVPTLPDPELRMPRWVIALLRDRLLPTGLAAPHRRIYVGRGPQRYNRKVENEPEVIAALAQWGVTAVDPGALTVDEQIRTFAEAQLIVAAHGAALTNLAFCSPGATVIELFAPDYVNVCYWGLACQVDGLSYRYVVGEGRAPRPGTTMFGVSSDIEVDIGKLVSVLEWVEG